MRELIWDEYWTEVAENADKLSMLVKGGRKTKDDKFVTIARILDLDEGRCHLIGDILIGYEFEKVLVRDTRDLNQVDQSDIKYFNSCVKVGDHYEVTFTNLLYKPVTDSLSRIWNYIIRNAKTVVPNEFELVKTSSFDDYFEYKNEDGDKIKFVKDNIRKLYFD